MRAAAQFARALALLLILAWVAGLALHWGQVAFCRAFSCAFAAPFESWLRGASPWIVAGLGTVWAIHVLLWTRRRTKVGS